TWPTIAQLTVDTYQSAADRMRPRAGFDSIVPTRANRAIASLVHRFRHSRQHPPPAESPGPAESAAASSAKVGAVPGLLNVKELCATEWWQQFTEIARKT